MDWWATVTQPATASNGGAWRRHYLYEGARVVLAAWAGFVAGIWAIAGALAARNVIPDFHGFILLAFPVWFALGALLARRRLPAVAWALLAVVGIGLLVARLVTVGHLVTM
jgi:hypothetical protein